MTASNKDMKRNCSFLLVAVCCFHNFSSRDMFKHTHTFCDKIEKHLEQQNEETFHKRAKKSLSCKNAVCDVIKGCE